MDIAAAGTVSELASTAHDDILTQWMKELVEAGVLSTGRITEQELRTQCRSFLQLLARGVDAQGVERIRDMLADLSRNRAAMGFSPTETATFIFSLKQVLFRQLDATDKGSTSDKNRKVLTVDHFFDSLGLFTMETYQKTREEVIIRQQREIAELSTPVVKLWDGILALPVIGTLDSQRTQVVMENLLQTIVDEGAEIAIVDITGVPTVDTLTAQHLLKTVAAARLMGADCIISGIRPQIAQTMVHLGVELNVTTKATLADAFAIALRRLGRTVTNIKQTRPADTVAQGGAA